MPKTKTERQSNVIPFVGYLQPEVPTTTNEKTTTPSIITFAVLLFAAGLAMGAISVHQSADYSQMEALKTQAKKLTEIKSSICNY